VFWDTIRFPRISENYHRVLRIRENRVPRIREIGSLQINTRYLTFSFENPGLIMKNRVKLFFFKRSIHQQL